jgi:hypothetical protein
VGLNDYYLSSKIMDANDACSFNDGIADFDLIMLFFHVINFEEKSMKMMVQDV